MRRWKTAFRVVVALLLVDPAKPELPKAPIWLADPLEAMERIEQVLRSLYANDDARTA